MSEYWEGKGVCPFCGSKDDFRELTFSENLQGVVFWGLSLFTFSKKKRISSIVDTFSKTGYMPNFICNSCNGSVHQCGGCKCIIPYTDTDPCPKCGYK